MNFTDRLTPQNVQSILDALALPWRSHLRSDGTWCDLPPEALKQAGFSGFVSDLSINTENGSWIDQFGKDGIQLDEVPIKGDLPLLVSRLNWESDDAEKAIFWMKERLDMSNNSSKTDVHFFNTDDAKRYGVECAAILYNLRFWLDKNRANGTNIHEGRVWTYNSREAFAELFLYLSEDQIYRRLKTLEDEGIVLTGYFNKSPFDRTKWYTVNEPKYIENDAL